MEHWWYVLKSCYKHVFIQFFNHLSVKLFDNPHTPRAIKSYNYWENPRKNNIISITIRCLSRPLGRFSSRIGRENLWCCHAQVLSVCLSVCLSGWKRDLVCQKCASMQTSKIFGIKITFWDCSFSFTFNLQHQDSSMSYFSKIALTVTKKRQNHAPENSFEC